MRFLSRLTCPLSWNLREPMPTGRSAENNLDKVSFPCAPAPISPISSQALLRKAFCSVQLSPRVKSHVLYRISQYHKPRNWFVAFLDANLVLSPATILTLITVGLLLVSVFLHYEPYVSKLSRKAQTKLVGYESQIKKKATSYFIDTVSSVLSALVNPETREDEPGRKFLPEENNGASHNPTARRFREESLYAILSEGGEKDFHPLGETWPSKPDVSAIAILNLKELNCA